MPGLLKMNFCIKTYGCQMNERDSEAIGELLIRHGHNRVVDEAGAEVLIVNTCSIRGKAENKAVGKLGVLVHGKKSHPGLIVGAVGCMVQRMKEDLFRQVPELDFAVGTHKLSRLPEIVDLVLRGQGPVLDAGEGGESLEELSGHIRGSVSAYINILLGCERGCAYCVVPFVRGKERSRPGFSVVEEVRNVVAQGCVEVTLLGQSVMSYGRTNPVWPLAHVSPMGFTEPLARLLEAVSGVDGLKRIRFYSGHPSGITPEIARTMSELPAVCEHMHLPLQSGSDRILRMMRRGYTADDYRRAVDLLRAKVPGLALTTDIIVGFPGETHDDFEETYKFMAEIGFDNSFIFKYSPRPGTPSCKMTDDVTPAEKMRRNKVLLTLQDEMGLVINGRTVGQLEEVLVEGVSLRNQARWAGRTRTGKIVIFEPGPDTSPGDIVKLKIERVMAQTLYGNMI